MPLWGLIAVSRVSFTEHSIDHAMRPEGTKKCGTDFSDFAFRL